MLLFVVGWAVSLFFLTRTILILAGLLKGPVLQLFERYGEEEAFYNPMQSLLVWIGLFVFTGGTWLIGYSKAYASIFLISAVCWLAAYYLHGVPDFAQKHPRLFLKLPHWYYELSERTERLERRRIAYMWLRLPWRLRLIYNSNDTAFVQWADMVIIGTLEDERQDDELVHILYNV
jgi:hypothetical protein